jgi:Multicopper oxidase
VGYAASTRRVTEGCRYGVVPTDAAGRMAGHQGHAAPVLPGRREDQAGRQRAAQPPLEPALPPHRPGITTRPMDQPGTQPGFAIDLDFVDHQLRIHTLDATPIPPSARLSCGRSVPRTWSIRFTSIWRRSRSSPSAAATSVPTTRAGRTLSTATTATTQPYWSPRRLPGRYVFHRHNLEHEDMQMMGNFQVT